MLKNRKIKILHCLEGAAEATGLTVVIDVFRAFSVACYLTANGAGEIIPVSEIETARELKAKHPEWILIGERYGKKLPGFDYGNSPTEVEGVDFTGKTIVHTTHAGTQGLILAASASETITGSFVNAEAVSRYILKKDPEKVSLVCMGLNANARTEEDTLCAEYIKNRLRGKEMDFAALKSRLRESACAARFFDPALPWNPPSDFELCLRLSRFPFVLRLRAGAEGLKVLRKVAV